MSEPIKLIADEVRKELEDTPKIIRKILWLHFLTVTITLLKFASISIVAYLLFSDFTNEHFSVTLNFMEWLKFYFAILFTGWGVTFCAKV